MPGAVKFSSSTIWVGGDVADRVTRGGQIGVNRALEFGKSISVPLAPLDLGPLRESASIMPASEANLEGALVFDSVYAAVQHEHLEFRHDDGQAKYVEEPWVANQKIMHGLIAKGVKDAIAHS